MKIGNAAAAWQSLVNEFRKRLNIFDSPSQGPGTQCSAALCLSPSNLSLKCQQAAPIGRRTGALLVTSENPTHLKKNNENFGPSRFFHDHTIPVSLNGVKIRPPTVASFAVLFCGVLVYSFPWHAA
jgi:hypothetical protein